MMDYRGKKVVIVGLGLTGLSCVDFFISRGVMPYVMDTRITPPGLERLPTNVAYCFGEIDQTQLLSADLIVVSPGVPLTTAVLQQAQVADIEMVGDIELFCREVQGVVVAITGSNGKSTVATLVGEMAKAAGLRVGVGGNIGLPALTLLKAAFPLYVLELSSFQLETTTSLRATAATILNVTEDHMDRYPLGLEQYRAAKLRIYTQAQTCILNAEDALTWPLQVKDKSCIYFGKTQGKYHLILQQGKEYLGVAGKALLQISEMALRGGHNTMNALAALALADTVGIPQEASLQALKTFNGLAHRFQLAHERNGVRWINDSKATNVGSTEAALDGLHLDGTLHLLLGGDGKSANFNALKKSLQAQQVKLYCFGRDAEKLAALRPEIAERTETLVQAMQLAAKRVKPGDMVLLSPACASLDQFSNFEQRGETFMRLAQELG